MNEITIVCALFLVSLGANAFITRYSAQRILGVEISLLKSGVVVFGRTLAALLAGFCVGLGLKVGFDANIDLKWVKLGALALMTSLSFIAYWFLLGKMSKTQISFWGMTKTAATETAIMIGAIIAIAFVLSILMLIFGKL